MKKENFNFYYPLKVSIRDINYGGHVGNDAYLSYYQEGRIAYLKHLGFSELDMGGCGMILVKSELSYASELFHQDQLKVYCRISLLKNTSFVMDYLIEKQPDIVASYGSTVLVAFNYQERKVVKIPATFQEKVKNLEKMV